MDRKSKIWLGVLVVLLIAAIAAIVLFNNKLTDSSAQLASVKEQLSAEQQNAATLTEKLDAAQTSYDELSAQMAEDAKTAEETAKDLQGKLETAQASAKTSSERVKELEGQLTEAQTSAAESADKATTLETQLADAMAQVSASAERLDSAKKTLAGLIGAEPEETDETAETSEKGETDETGATDEAGEADGHHADQRGLHGGSIVCFSGLLLWFLPACGISKEKFSAGSLGHLPQGERAADTPVSLRTAGAL